MNRRQFLKATGVLALSAGGAGEIFARSPERYVNDIHSQLNRTWVGEILRPATVEELRDTVRLAGRRRAAISVAGGRHAMGGQQFATGSLHIDTRSLSRVVHFDRERGLLEVEAGIEWPELIRYYLDIQGDAALAWGVAQKQTGADRFTIGGTMAANAHGRVLTHRPIIADIESFVLLDAAGETRSCSRAENSELFRLAIGGYGLFGIVTSATLRLVPRQKVQRVVEVVTADRLASAFAERIGDGFMYGDFQFSTDERSEDYMNRGVFSCYRPVDASRPIPLDQKRLTDENWKELLYLAHADKAAGFQRYSTYYLSTTGQLYWSDTHQMSTYTDDYHRPLDKRLGATRPATEIITEINVPRGALADFLAEAREDLRKNRVNLIYGTIRLIERDDESFLAWAKEPYACTIFNLHTPHTREGLRHSAAAFRRLIDMAIRRGGSYYLTYHRFAERAQIEACYPQFAEFLRLKRRYDPDARFQSDWWRHHARMFGMA